VTEEGPYWTEIWSKAAWVIFAALSELVLLVEHRTSLRILPSKYVKNQKNGEDVENRTVVAGSNHKAAGAFVVERRIELG